MNRRFHRLQQWHNHLSLNRNCHWYSLLMPQNDSGIFSRFKEYFANHGGCRRFPMSSCYRNSLSPAQNRCKYIRSMEHRDPEPLCFDQFRIILSNCSWNDNAVSPMHMFSFMSMKTSAPLDAISFRKSELFLSEPLTANPLSSRIAANARIPIPPIPMKKQFYNYLNSFFCLPLFRQS